MTGRPFRLHLGAPRKLTARVSLGAQLSGKISGGTWPEPAVAMESFEWNLLLFNFTLLNVLTLGETLLLLLFTVTLLYVVFKQAVGV